MKLLKNKLLFISLLFVSFLIKTLIKETSIADAIILLSLASSYSFLYYLHNKEIVDPSIELKKEVDFLKNKMSEFSITKVAQKQSFSGKF